MMEKKEIFEMMNANPACHLATVEGTKARVRGMLLYSADEKGIIFHTGKFKDLFTQLQHNPHVEFCFNDSQNNVQVRVSGIAKLDENIELKKEIVKKRPFLQPMVDAQGYDPLAVYRVTDLQAAVWTMESNFEPKSYIALM